MEVKVCLIKIESQTKEKTCQIKHPLIGMEHEQMVEESMRIPVVLVSGVRSTPPHKF